jgi:hypothetical protein
MLEKCITEEQHSVVSFLWAKGLNAKDHSLQKLNISCHLNSWWKQLSHFLTEGNYVLLTSLVTCINVRCTLLQFIITIVEGYGGKLIT